jgi:hypothetical protein
LFAAGATLTRCQPEPGGKIARGFEHARIGHGGHDGGRPERTQPRYRHQSTGVIAFLSFDLSTIGSLSGLEGDDRYALHVCPAAALPETAVLKRWIAS